MVGRYWHTVAPESLPQPDELAGSERREVAIKMISSQFVFSLRSWREHKAWGASLRLSLCKREAVKTGDS
jgi:hypothetical protein